MSFITPQVGQAGLALLLQPGASAVLLRTACTVVGTVYPVFESLKAVENDKADESHVQWLTYWSVYGTLQLVEGWSDTFLGWFPFYYHAKLAFLVWLMLPKTQGAKLLYKNYGRPWFLKYREQVDSVLGNFQKHLEAYLASNEESFKMAKGMFENLLEYVKSAQSKSS
mmetsp:Transcript_138/g.505  ORF Transcript_138/g.505 Transcript_138/m.505 type:complete len:168 (-) Transcript_138:99-602(-)